MATILVVDDNPTVLQVARAVLTGAGHQVLVTQHPDRVAGLVEAEAVDAVVLDVVMPGRSGFEVLAELKQRGISDNVLVLMLSALTDGADRVRGLREGAADYLTKPLEPEELLLKLDRLLTLRQQSAGSGLPADSLPIGGSRLTPQDQQWLERVHEVLTAGISDENFSVETLAERLAIHRSQLYRRLQKLTGASPNKLIVAYRMERAAAMLRNDSVSVAEVAEAIGFQSSAHFCRAFRSQFGQTPSAYQRSCAEST